MAEDPSHSPANLHRASLERMDSAWRLYRQDPATAFYLGGLAVECLLQAIALRASAQHDARHDLLIWLAKCSPDLVDHLKTPPRAVFWSRLVAEWNNGARYWDHDALLGWARKQPRWRTYHGNDHARMQQFIKGFLQAADEVHRQGLAEWQRSNN